jgi:hypothetical protein
VRGLLPLLRDRLIPYAQLSVGPAVAFTKWSDPAGTARDSFVGYQLGALAGLAVMPRPAWGLFLQAAYAYAPIIDNRLGQTHDSGGLGFQLGGRYGF